MYEIETVRNYCFRPHARTALLAISNEVLRGGTKGPLILRYDDDGCSVVFSEILQCIRKRAGPRDAKRADVPAGSSSVIMVIGVVF